MIARSLLPLLFTFWTGLAPGATDAPDGEVDEVRIASAGTETEITVVTEGAVEVRDFLLEEPPRLIVDLEGARHAMTRHAFEGIGRGGVVRLRSSQFRDDVVRLVFDLSRPVDYEVEQDGSGIRVTFANPGQSFTAWSSASGAGPASAAATTGGDGAGADVAEGASPASTGEASVDEAAGGTDDSVDEDIGPTLASRDGAAALPQQSGQPTISVRYDSASILDVLAGFSDFSGRSIVPGEGVTDQVVRGVDIQEQPWDVALDAILQAQGLGWSRLESGIILVDDLSSIRSRDTLRTETRVFRINYSGADSVADALRELSTERGQVVPYQSTNSVIVTDAPSSVTRMDSLINVLDRQTPQVTIEAKIVFVDRTNISELGLTYDLRDRTGLTSVDAEDSGGDGEDGEDGDGPTTVDLGGSSVAAVGNANANLRNQSALDILAATAFGDFSLFAFLQAVEEHNLTDVQAAPAIQVTDNHSARIQVGERTPIRVLEPSAQQQQAQVNVQFEDTGIILEVTPHITNNNQILLDLMAERSAVNTAVAADLGFVFDKQIGESRLLLDDGETAVIGGLTTSELSRARRGIPGLMNIPVLGNLFRTTSEEENKQDLIILVTPHIVGSGATGSSSGMEGAAPELPETSG